MKILSFTITILLFAAASTFAAPTLDQYHEYVQGSTPVRAGMSLAQTFTAGLSGTLDHIEISAGYKYPDPAYSTTVTITSSGPDGSVLGSVNMPSGFTVGWNSISFLSQNISITAGNVYAIVLSNDDPDFQTDPTASWDICHPGQYSSGAFYYKLTGADWVELNMGSPVDAAFRTYVEPLTVPAPGALLLAALGTTCIT